MAVSKMKKLSVVTMREDTDSLLRALQKLQCVNLISTSDTSNNTEQPDITERIAT